MTATLMPTPDSRNLIQELVAPTDKIVKILGIFTVLIVISFLLWGAFVPIASGVVARGTVGVENRRKTIQHLDGGIVRQIFVREGSYVHAGDLLFRLDDTEAKLTVSILQGQVDSLRAEQAARNAELVGTDKIIFPPDLLSRAQEPGVAAVVKAQRMAFAARRDNLSGRKAQLQKQLIQLDREIAGNSAQAASRTEQIVLLDSEIHDVEGLLKKGLTTRTRLLALQRSASQSRGERGSLDSEIAKLKTQQAEVSIESMQLERQSNADASDILRQIESQLVAGLDRLEAAKSALNRTQIRSPVSGTVVGLNVNTLGAVIRPGEVLVDVVPSAKRLVVTAKVDPKDANAIYVGQMVNVRLDGAGLRYAPVIQGKVERFSADSLIDQRSGGSYFEITVRIPGREIAHVPNELLRPGVPADILVRTGHRTAFEYLLAPLINATFSAMRER